MIEGLEMLFEYTIRSYLGDEASHITGQAHSEKSRKKWYRKITKKIIRKIQEIESNSTHKERLAHCSEDCLTALNHPYNEINFTLYILRLLNVLLGYYGGLRPYRIATLAYFQTCSQHRTEAMVKGDDMPDYDENTLSIRKKIIGQLKEEGKTYFQISLALNLSEYEVQKLGKGL